MDISKTLARLQRSCSRREYCSRDIFEKALKALDGNREEAASVLERLKADNYVNDARYATAFARDKSSINGWGPAKIRVMLSAKGISPDDIKAALCETDRQAANLRMERLIENKWRVLKDDPQGKLKLIRFALGRGYEYSDVKEVVERII